MHVCPALHPPCAVSPNIATGRVLLRSVARFRTVPWHGLCSGKWEKVLGKGEGKHNSEKVKAISQGTRFRVRVRVRVRVSGGKSDLVGEH